MAARGFAFLLWIITVSICVSLKCPYLQWNTGGPAMPCNVCLTAVDCDIDGGGNSTYDGNCTAMSYLFDCTFETLNVYTDGYCRDAGQMVDISSSITTNDFSGAGLTMVCDHVTVRSYPSKLGQNGEACVKETESGFYEVALLTGCYDSLIAPQRSADLSCTDIDDGLEINYHRELGCGDNGAVLNNRTRIHGGCGNKVLNFGYLQNLFPGRFGVNMTYFELEECGNNAWPSQWLIDLIIAAAAVASLCLCGCSILVVWWCSCRRKQKNTEREGLIGN